MSSPSSPRPAKAAIKKDGAGKGDSIDHAQAAEVQITTAPASDPSVRAALESNLKLAAQGNQRAWRTLVDTYTGRVFGLIRAQCGDTDLAEEITQSTFCTVVAKIGSYTELGRFEQWLFRIAMNRLRDEMRRRKRQARPVEDEALRAFADAGGNMDHPRGRTERVPGEGGAADPEQLQALRTALSQMPEADQHIIHLRHNAGLSFKEIAEVLEQPLGTVLARQHRALKKLAELMEQAMERPATIGQPRGGAAGPRTQLPEKAGRLGNSPDSAAP